MNKTTGAAIIIIAAVTASAPGRSRAARQNPLLEAFIDASKTSVYNSQLATSLAADALNKKTISPKEAKRISIIQQDLLALLSWQLDKTLENPEIDSQNREKLQQINKCLLDNSLALGTFDTYIAKPSPELSKNLNKKLAAARGCANTLAGVKE